MLVLNALDSIYYLKLINVSEVMDWQQLAKPSSFLNVKFDAIFLLNGSYLTLLLANLVELRSENGPNKIDNKQDPQKRFKLSITVGLSCLYFLVD